MHTDGFSVSLRNIQSLYHVDDSLYQVNILFNLLNFLINIDKNHVKNLNIQSHEYRAIFDLIMNKNPCTLLNELNFISFDNCNNFANGIIHEV
jgi:hypothetical protein